MVESNRSDRPFLLHTFKSPTMCVHLLAKGDCQTTAGCQTRALVDMDILVLLSTVGVEELAADVARWTCRSRRMIRRGSSVTLATASGLQVFLVGQRQ